MFEKFSQRARRVVVLAQGEARSLNHNYIGPEHLLIGILHEMDSTAAKALAVAGFNLNDLRDEVGEAIGRGSTTPEENIPFTPRAKKILELAHRESLRLGHKHIGTEHLLLGILVEEHNLPCGIFQRHGHTTNYLHGRVVDFITPKKVEVSLVSQEETEQGWDPYGRVAEDIKAALEADLGDTTEYVSQPIEEYGTPQDDVPEEDHLLASKDPTAFYQKISAQMPDRGLAPSAGVMWEPPPVEEPSPLAALVASVTAVSLALEKLGITPTEKLLVDLLHWKHSG